MDMRGISFIALLVALFAPPASAAVFSIFPSDNWKQILNNSNFLQPGDELIFGAGVYAHDSFISIGYQGTAANPITMRAADGANVLLVGITSGQNVLNVEGAQHLTIKGFQISGGSNGIRISQGSNGDQAKFITLDGNTIHDTGSAAVTANRSGQTYEGMHFLRNEIYNTSSQGEGFYLGCNNNACQFYDGIIEQNYIHHLNGPGVTQGDGIEIKDGSYNNIVRDNVVHDTNFPGIIAFGVEEQGARNIIERNVVWNSNDHAIQVAADAIVRNNIIFSSAKDGIHSQNHQGAIPGNLTIEHNTIQTSRDAIRIGPPTGGTLSGPIIIANNALYTGGTLAINTNVLTDTTISNNIGTGFSTGGLSSSQFDNSGNLATDFVDFLNMNAFPAVGSKLVGAADLAYLANEDFNTSSRAGTADVGAYLYNLAGNPGWQVGLGFKEFPLVSAGVAGDFNDDGIVDAVDYTVWLDNLGSSFDLSGNGDEIGGSAGVVDAADYTLWKSSFGNTSFGNTSGAGAGSSVVPEPSSILLFCLGMISWTSRRQRFFA